MSEHRRKPTLAELAAAALDAGDGVRCPKCGCRHLVRIPGQEPGARQQKKCRNCEHVITTVKKPEPAELADPDDGTWSEPS